MAWLLDFPDICELFSCNGSPSGVGYFGCSYCGCVRQDWSDVYEYIVDIEFDVHQQQDFIADDWV